MHHAVFLENNYADNTRQCTDTHAKKYAVLHFNFFVATITPKYNIKNTVFSTYPALWEVFIESSIFYRLPGSILHPCAVDFPGPV